MPNLFRRLLLSKWSKRLTLLFTLLAILFISCKIEYELWVDKSGAGRGYIYLSGTGLTKTQIESAMKEKESTKSGVIVLSVSERSYDNYAVEFQFLDFEKAFGTRRINEDGSIYLGFDKLGAGGYGTSLTVHVDGKIDNHRTTGNIINGNTVVFSGGQAELVYYPPSPIQFLPFLIIGIIIIVAGVVLLTVGLQKRKRKEAVPDMKKINNLKFCPQCGSKNELDDIFCKECGAKLE